MSESHAAETPTEPLILVVDDEPSMSTLLRAALWVAGFRVIEAPDGNVGLAMARDRRPTLVTTDLMMPRMDGWQLIRALKADQTLRDLPIIVRDSGLQPGNAERALTSG